jgi:CRP/FNR family transcriptional regulator
LLERTLTELDRSRRWMLLLGRMTAEQKVASFLLEIGERLGNAKARAGTHVPLPLSRQQIADVLGLTIETVSRQLTRLRNAGVIDLPSRREIVLQDLPDLEARAS